MDTLNIWIILAQIINFLFLILIFKYFLWNKIVKMIEERKKKLLFIEAVEVEARRKLSIANQEAERIIEEARQKWEHIEDIMHDRAVHKKEKMLAAAHFQAENMVATARADMEKERAMMVSFLKSKVLWLAYSLNQKLFSSKKVNKEFMEKELFKFSQEKDT